METLLRNSGIPPDHPGAAALKGLLDNGIPFDDVRCQTLVQLLTNCARPQPAPPAPPPPPSSQQNHSDHAAALALNQFSHAKDGPISRPDADPLAQSSQPQLHGSDVTAAVAANQHLQQRHARAIHSQQQQHAQLPRLPALGSLSNQPNKSPMSAHFAYPPQQHSVAHDAGMLAHALRQPEQSPVGAGAAAAHSQAMSADSQRQAAARAQQAEMSQLTDALGLSDSTRAYANAQRSNALPSVNVTSAAPQTPIAPPAAAQVPASPVARSLFQPVPWPANGKPNGGVPYLPPSGAAQLRFSMQPANVYGTYSGHLMAQQAHGHAQNCVLSHENTQHAIQHRRLLLEQEAARNYSRPRNAAAPAIEMTSQPALDPAQYFTSMYSSPSQSRQTPTATPSSRPVRSPASERNSVPATGAKPPPMPTTLRSIAATPPKRKRTPAPQTFVESEVLEEGSADDLLGSTQLTAPAPSPSPPLSKPDPRAGGDPKTSKQKNRRKNTKKADKRRTPVSEDDGSESRLDSEDDETQPSSEGSTTKSLKQKGDSRTPNGVVNGPQDILDSIDTTKLNNVFHAAKKIASQEKSKRKRKRTKKGANASKQSVEGLEQKVNGVKAKHAFQARAQVEAYRNITRGLEPPMDVSVASGGAEPLSRFVANGLMLPSDILSANGLYSQDARASAKNIVKPTTQIPRTSTPMAPKQPKVTPIPPLKSPEPFQYLPFRRNERIYTYRREMLENFARNRGWHPVPYAPNSKAAKPAPTSDESTSKDAENGTVAVPNGALSTQVQVPPSAPNPVHPLGVARPTIAKTNPAVPITISGPQYNGRHFRDLLLEREQRIELRISSRLNEINSLPDDMPEDVRRRVIVEKKKLNLLNLQRNARSEVTGVMRSMFARGNSVFVGEQRTKIFKRPTPQTWYWRSATAPGVRLAHPGDTLSAAAKKQVQIMEQRHRAEQEARKLTKRRATMNNLLMHAAHVSEFHKSRAATLKKLHIDLDRHFRSKAREEERRKRKEQLERLKALRENDEDAYMKLLKNTKNTRLLQLLKQTDEYLAQIGAKVEQQKQAARNDVERQVAQDMLVVPSEGDNEEGATGEHDDDEFSAMRKRRNDYYTVTHSVKEKVYQPKCLIGGKLKPYQREGLEWLVSLYNNNLNGILADEMGLGKTIQTLALVTYLVEVKQCSGPFLVIVPLSTISNWVRELERWAPSLTKIVYRGDPNTRRSIYNRQMAAGGYNVLLTTYEFIVKDTKVLGKVQWKYIIIDEGHRMKNADCKLALTLGSKYRSKNRLLLTGTPLQNNLTELWALLNFLLPTIFSNSETFEQWFNSPFQAACLGGNQSLDEEENLLVISRLHQVLRPFMLRRLKTDVECQLPDKVEEVLKCEMSAWQRILYRQMRDRLGIAAGGSRTTNKAFNNVVMQLKKIANHPYLFYEDELNSLPRDFLIRTSGKFELLNHVLKKLKATNHRVLIFSQMTHALDFLEMFLYNIGIQFMRLDGSTKADDRTKMLEDFNAPDSPYFCFLLSTRAGGLGLNLQTADTVIIFDSDWNPMMDLQAQDRAHRIGQTKEVRVLRLICAGTIEVQILQRANQKLRMDEQVIQAGQFNNKSSDTDRQEMLKDILRSRDNEDELATNDATSLEAINRSLARSDEELEMFEQMDAARLNEAKETGISPLMVDESEVPEWVKLPEVEQKSKEQLEAEYIEQHGRGQRKRRAVTYADNLTEEEFTHVVESDGDLEGAARRKRRKMAEEESDNEAYTPPQQDDEETGKRKRPRGRPRNSNRSR